MLDISGTIQRINHSTADRFPVGTVVTLLFEQAGVSVSHGGYITLLGGVAYVSEVGSSLTLVSSGPGTWRELDRNLPSP